MEIIVIKIKYNTADKTFFLFFLLLFFLAVQGCATVAQNSGPELEPTPLPAYKKGTTFVYSDGSWETVIDVTQGLVTWRDYRGKVYSGSADFSYQPIRWQTRTRQGERQFGPRKNLYGKQALSLWPLRAGNSAGYSETGTWSKKGGKVNTYAADWSCDVAGTEQVAVLAGQFDAWKITCKRYSTPSIPSKAKVTELNTWYYAPVIGHYVKTTRQYFSGKPSRRLELLAVLPPLEELSSKTRRQIKKSFQYAMEYKKSGEIARWSGPEASGETVPQSTFKLEDGSFSRRYVQRLRLSDGQHVYYGMAVRDSRGDWVIPRK
jgi:hypothetical protein